MTPWERVFAGILIGVTTVALVWVSSGIYFVLN